MSSATFSGLNVKRGTVGFQRAATVGIRAKVAAMLSAAGPSGVTSDELAGCWPGNGTAAKVAECANIMAGDKYGYAVERLPHPVSRGLDRYRLSPTADQPAVPTVAPDASGADAPDLTAAPHVPAADPEPAAEPTSTAAAPLSKKARRAAERAARQARAAEGRN